ncbi:MAG: hypothetical protein Q9159_005112 [Coniocarpon cinnabarinum]
MSSYEEQWMQPPEFDLAFDLAEAPASHDPNYSSLPLNDFAQFYGEQPFSQQQPATGLEYHTATQYPGSHRRFASTSSVASGGAESHFGGFPQAPYQQYPAPQPHLSPYQSQQQTSWNYETTSPLSTTTHHLPTPIGTPKSDASFQATNARRSRPSTGRETARAAAHQSVRSALNQQWKPDTYTHLQTQSRAFPYQEMPQTPQTVHGDDPETQTQTIGKATFLPDAMFGANNLLYAYSTAPTHIVPKFDRTVSDAQADELYNPAPIPHLPSAPRFQPPSVSNLFTQQPAALQEKLRAANEARSASPAQSSGQASPWRNPSTGNGVGQYSSSNMPAPPMGDRRPDAAQQETEEVKTVSPQDAFPQEQLSKQDENLPPLISTESNQSNSSNVQYAPYTYGSQEYGSYTSTSMPQSTFSFAAPSVPASASGLDFRNNYYQQAHPGVQYGPVNGDYASSYSVPAHLTSMETTKSDESELIEESSEGSVERPSPSDTLANGGRYTCPYSDQHGSCGARFETGSELNKHKREFHRQAGPASTDAKRATGMTQTGPHRCTRNNPSTGKPCNTVFSRPYDLTRHEDTIHGEGKKLKCQHCPEEKLFSRNDALTRHLKVVHSQASPIGKQRGRRQGT